MTAAALFILTALFSTPVAGDDGAACPYTASVQIRRPLQADPHCPWSRDKGRSTPDGRLGSPNTTDILPVSTPSNPTALTKSP